MGAHDILIRGRGQENPSSSLGIHQEGESAYLGIGFVRLRSLQKRLPRKWEIDELKAIRSETDSEVRCI